MWICSVLIVAYLYYNWHVDLNYIGIVERRSHSLGPQEPGKIHSVLVNVGDRVEKDQVLAILDMPDLKASLTHLRNEFKEIQTLHHSQKVFQEMAVLNLRMQTENEVSGLIDRLSLIESKSAELNGLNQEIDRLRDAELAGLGYSRDLSALIIQRDALEGYLREQRSEFHRFSSQLKGVRDSRESLENADLDSLTRSLLLEHLEYSESIRREIILTEYKIQMRTIYSPSEGYVTEVLAHPGDVVQDFDSLVVVEELAPKYLTVYLPEKTKLIPTPGTEVRIFSSRQRSFNTTGIVTFVHPGFTQADKRLSFRGMQFWARKIRVELTEVHQLLPGEVVTVRIKNHRPKDSDLSAADLGTESLSLIQRETIDL